MHCLNGSFPGIDRDGGFAEYLLTSARSVVKLGPGLEPKDIAALADAGLTAIHAVKKAIPVLSAGTHAVVIGAGGLGHIGIQCLKAMTPAEIIVIDPSEQALALAGEMGADRTVQVDAGAPAIPPVAPRSTSASIAGGRRSRENTRPAVSHARAISAPMAARRSASRTTTNSHGCLFSALGARTAASRIARASSSSTGASQNSRHARCAWTTAKKPGSVTCAPSRVARRGAGTCSRT